MRWYAISGSWRAINKSVEKDVTNTVKNIIESGDGIITGGALGVDYIAAETALKYGNPEKQLRIHLPINLNKMCRHFFRKAKEGIIAEEQAVKITLQYKRINNICKKCIFDKTRFSEANTESYYDRNKVIINNCDELYAFQVNESQGTQDAINKSKKLGKPAHIKKYII